MIEEKNKTVISESCKNFEKSEPIAFLKKSNSILSQLILFANLLIEQINQKLKGKLRLKGRFYSYYYQIFDDSVSQIIIIKNSIHDINLKLSSPEFMIDFSGLINNLENLIRIEFKNQMDFSKRKYVSITRQIVIYLENNPSKGIELILSFPIPKQT